MAMSTPQKCHCEPWQLHHKQIVEAQEALHPAKREVFNFMHWKYRLFVSYCRPDPMSVKYQQTCTLRVVLYNGSNCPDGFISRGTL